MNAATPRRCVIVNADDFGLSPGINQGVIESFEQGIVTGASLMTRGPAAEEAAAYARRNMTLSVGLHLDFGEWEYRGGEWIRLYRVVDENDVEAVENEIRRQLNAFEHLVGRPPTHIDSHQHVHLVGPARTCVLEAGQRLNVPVRCLNPEIRYCGTFYGQNERGDPYPENISVEGLLGTLRAVEPGVTEIGCHPAARLDVDSIYRFERLLELEALCAPRVRAAVAEMDIELRSFAHWRSYAFAHT